MMRFFLSFTLFIFFEYLIDIICLFFSVMFIIVLIFGGESYASKINFLRLGTADKNDKMDLGVNLAKDISLLPLKGKIGDEIIQLINYSDKNN